MSKFNQIVKSNKITPENLKLLFVEIRMMRNKNYIEKNENLCAEIVSLIIEYLIYGDKNNSSIFDVFCECNFMNEFIYLNTLGSRQISIQIIQSFSILILNVSNPMTQYFIFSNNFINHIISQDCSKHDDEFIAYYINFIKSLTLKINSNTIQFFFHEQHNSFLLIESAMKFYNHPDSMIKTTVRNIFLTFLKLNFNPIYDYFAKLPAISYFPFLVINLRDLIVKLNDESLSEDFKNLNDINDDILDIILYFQDIFSIKNVKINNVLINNVLINCIFYYIGFPILIGAITSLTKPRINMTISIYILTLLFKYIKDETFLNMLFTFIFFKKIDPIILNYIKDYPQCPKNYQEWHNKKSGQNLNFSNYITFNFSENFIKSLIFQTNSEFPEILAIFKKFEKTSEDYTDESFYVTILEDVLSKFEPSEFNAMQAYHKNLSIATGQNVGLKIFDFKLKSIIKITEFIYYRIKEKQDNDFIDNECRENLLCYFKSKDDSLILLLSLLVNTVHRSNISKEVLSCGKFLKASDFIASRMSTNNILKDIFSNIDFSNINNDSNLTYYSQNKFSLNHEFNDIANQFNINDSLFIEEEEEKEIPCHKGDNLNPFKPSQKSNDNINEDHHDEINSLLARDFVKIQTDMIIEKTQKQSITKKNLDKIIKLNMDNKIISDQTTNQINKEIVFDKIFFASNFIKLKFQSEYDKELVENLLNLLTVEPSFRIVTLRLILENLENIVLHGSIDKNHLTMFNKIYFTYLSGIKLNIMTNKQIREYGYEYLEIEWLNYKKDFNSIINSLISQPFLLIPFNLEDTISEYPQLLKIQKSEIDHFKKSLFVFMNLYDLRSKIYLLFDNIKEFFPLNIGTITLEIDKPFCISNNSDIYHCKVKSGTNKNIFNTFMCIDQNYLVFCTPDPLKTEFAIVKNKYALRHLEVQMDRSDPRILNTIVKEKEDLIDLAIYFDDVNRATTIKKQLEEHLKNSKSTEFILLVSYFDELLNKFNLDYNI